VRTLKHAFFAAVSLALAASLAAGRAGDGEVAPDVPVRVEKDLFHPPVRLQAADGFIDSGPSGGHSGPWLVDVDGDGVRDLVVGDMSGFFRFYRNEGTDRQPRYAKAVNLQAGGADAKVRVYCCMGSGPQFVDFDGDGKLDLVAGSYEPGELYLFRGLGGGKFAAREVIKDKSDKPILKVPDQKDAAESFCSWVTLVDWYGQGKLDVLVGTSDGMLFLRRNVGTRTEPVYATENEWVMVGPKRLRVPGGEHASPVIADWDGDGRWDILAGCLDGGVYWYRNVGTPGRPAFDPPVALVPGHAGRGFHSVLDTRQEPRPGVRSQIAVVDYDGDGKLDLLVGDYYTYSHLQLKKGLTPEQLRQFGAVRDRQDKALQEMRDAEEAVQDRWAGILKGIPKPERNSKENSARWQKMNVEMRESPAYNHLVEEFVRARQELQPYVEDDTSRVKPFVTHGYVWLFRRK
jgi:hypothetical protein